MTRIILVLAVAMVLTACAEEDPVDRPVASPAGNEPGELVTKGELPTGTDPVEEVFFNAAAFEQFWRDIVARSPDEAPPPIDWAQRDVIVVSLGQRNSGGYAIEITSVEDSDRTTRIAVRGTVPGPDCMTTSALTHPYVVRTVPKLMGEPRFDRFTDTRNC